jgi:enoyl-CoA hydratase/carnithine racemase
MLLHCDFVYLSEDASLSLPFVNLGLVPEAGASMLLPRLAGHQKAAELLLLGEAFTPQTAVEIGLANAVCKPADLEAVAMATAKKLAAKPRNALLQTKALLRREFESVTARIDKEVEIFKQCLGSEDAKEALTAFKEKRKPTFK